MGDVPAAGFDITVTAAPSQHFSGRGLKDRNATLWSSMIVRSDRHAVFFSGDTGLTTEYESIRDRLGPFDLVMLEIGAHHPAWGDIHLGPDNALKAHSLLGGGAFLPIHWGTFSLATHAWDQPPEVILEKGTKAGVQLVMPRLGEAVEPSHARNRIPGGGLLTRRGRRGRRTPKSRCPSRCPGRSTRYNSRFGEVDERFKSHAWKACLG